MNTFSDSKETRRDQFIPSSEFYSHIIDSLHDYAIFTVDIELNINSWNPGSTKIFQYETDEILGKPFEIIFTEEDKYNGIPKNEIDLALKNGRSNDVRWHQCKDGKIFYADGLVFPLTDLDDKVIGFVKILRDITNRKASEDAIKKYAEELEELNTHKETVLAILSHDLRSPLAGIIQSAEYLNAHFETIDPATAKNLLKELHIAALNELNMLDYLVEWARIKYTADGFVPDSIKLLPYVKKVFDSLKETAAINSVSFKHQISEDFSVFADDKMLISILQNLVSNAIKHSFFGGEITVSAKECEDGIMVEIKDEGIGISNEILAKLFSPQVLSFSQPLDKRGGAGIGLLLVKGLLDKSGGRIWVDSTEGKGSSFYFTLPINHPAQIMDVVE